MTDVEIRNNIPNMVKEELAGCKKYCEMAKVMSNGGHDDIARIFHDMGHEEYTHAMFAKHIGEKMGINLKMESEFEEAEKSLHYN